MNHFFAFEPSIHQFQEFGLSHIVPIIFIVFGVFMIYRYRLQLRRLQHEKTIRYTLAGIAIFAEVSFQIWQMAHGAWDFADSLPLHLCRLTNYLGIYVMLTKDKRVFEIAYFWSLSGVVSVLFPDILHGPDRFRYYHFMISHILFFFNFMYLLFVTDLPLTFQSFKKSFVTLFLLATVIIIPINNIFNVNYMYLLYPGDTPFTIFWGYGYLVYLIGCIGLVMIVITLWYVPTHFYNKKRIN
jgi:hypothetical integral membrane protein (TIGR02206 family)